MTMKQREGAKPEKEANETRVNGHWEIRRLIDACGKEQCDASSFGNEHWPISPLLEVPGPISPVRQFYADQLCPISPLRQALPSTTREEQQPWATEQAVFFVMLIQSPWLRMRETSNAHESHPCGAWWGIRPLQILVCAVPRAPKIKSVRRSSSFDSDDESLAKLSLALRSPPAGFWLFFPSEDRSTCFKSETATVQGLEKNIPPEKRQLQAALEDSMETISSSGMPN